LKVAVRYRLVGEPGWRESTTENISRSGVLFRADRAMAVDSRVEMRLELPIALPGGTPVAIHCRGRVARTVPPSDPNRHSAVAATIRTYHFARPVRAGQTGAPEL
jgi:hypothetical protein